MPKLKCEALKCIYNCNKYCAKSVIRVNNDSDSKKCESYSEKNYEAKDYKTEFADMNCGNQFVSIECKAKECDYNCNGMCVSENVKIGSESTRAMDGAKCETFSL